MSPQNEHTKDHSKLTGDLKINIISWVGKTKKCELIIKINY